MKSEGGKKLGMENPKGKMNGLNIPMVILMLVSPGSLHITAAGTSML